MHKRRKCVKTSGSHSLWSCHSSGMHHPCQSYITWWTACWHRTSNSGPLKGEADTAEATSTRISPIPQWHWREPSVSNLGIIPSAPLWEQNAGASWSILHPWIHKHFTLQLLQPQNLVAFPLLLHCHFDTGKNKEGSAHQETWCWRNVVLAVGRWTAWIWELSLPLPLMTV